MKLLIYSIKEKTVFTGVLDEGGGLI